MGCCEHDVWHLITHTLLPYWASEDVGTASLKGPLKLRESLTSCLGLFNLLACILTQVHPSLEFTHETFVLTTLQFSLYVSSSSEAGFYFQERPELWASHWGIKQPY